MKVFVWMTWVDAPIFDSLYIYTVSQLIPVWLRRLGHHGPLTRYAKLWVAHAPGMPGKYSLPARVSDPNMYHGGFFWSRWRGKLSRHSRRMRNPQFCVSGKRPIIRQVISMDSTIWWPRLSCVLTGRLVISIRFHLLVRILRSLIIEF